MLKLLLLSTLLSVSARADDCYGNHVGDADHADQMELENFGTDWAFQMTEDLLQDLLAEQFADPSVQPYLTWEGGFTILSSIDVDYRYVAQSVAVDLQDGEVLLDIAVEGHGLIGGVSCDGTGTMYVSARPEIEEASGLHEFALEDVVVDLSAFPVLCGIGPGSSHFSAVQSSLESQLETLLEREWFTIEDVVGIDAEVLEDLDHDLGGFDPYDDMQIAVVDGEPGFLMVGGSAVATASCGTEDYPLFDPDAFTDFRTFLGTGPVALAVSMRLVPVIAAQAEEEITEQIDDILSDLMASAGLGWVDVRFRRLTIWYSGLDSNFEPCDCTTGDTEYWFDLNISEPRIMFRIFFRVAARGFSILGWNPGPITLQLNGWADLSDGTVAINFTRANVYGTWWADIMAWVLDTFFGIDFQDAGLYNGYASDLEIAWLPDTIDTPAGTFATCGVDALFSAQILSFSPDDCAEGDSDLDGLSDMTELALGTDVGLADTDMDSLTDAYEVQLGCDPLSEDGDGDGASDWAEIVRMGTDCMDADSDDDGAPDGCEDDLGLVDPLDSDTDDDGDADGDEDLVTLGCP